jgi:hypothetical protein
MGERVVNPRPGTPPYEFGSPHIDATVWPWSIAGWSLAALLVLLFVLARLSS